MTKLTAVLLVTACLQVSAKGYSQKVIGKRKDVHGIDSLPYAFVTIGNLSQIPRLP